MATVVPREERRRFSRVSVERPAIFTAGSATCMAEVVDVSLQGALVALPPAFVAGPGTPCMLIIRLDGAEAVIQLEGEVVHRSGPRAGIRCTSMDLESVGHLRRMVELNLGDEELLHRELAALIGCDQA